MRKLIFTATLLFSSFLFAQSFETYANPKVSEIQKNFKFKKYSKKLLAEFSKQIVEEPNKIVTVSEFIPGEIIGWNNERGSYKSSQVFKINDGKLLAVETEPNSETFMKIINAYAPKNTYFEFNSIGGRNYDAEFVKKQKNGKYLMAINLIALKNDSDGSNSNFDNSSLYNLEYETLDFKTFKPLKIKKTESKNWITIK
ncbi:hypothetical protein CLU96_4526 [Chryseobacterium sp. 52]|uniref:hypothetical protein n=1 Tax=Chryseobacterium sp. 52 TaxID=2035213 RepID=UPI000C182631|nr:hypothetical protein [Chryseobacterium sp. 52]PIF47471.1 hypothetical protein CLU96_4526 [Chryseobacterium sp. 52]